MPTGQVREAERHPALRDPTSEEAHFRIIAHAAVPITLPLRTGAVVAPT
jgi:hypothetical protein